MILEEVVPEVNGSKKKTRKKRLFHNPFIYEGHGYQNRLLVSGSALCYTVIKLVKIL